MKTAELRQPARDYAPYSAEMVLIICRWLFVLSAILILARAAENTIGWISSVFGLSLLATINQRLHIKIIREEIVERRWLYSSSAADVALISLMTWQQGGLSGRVFPFYFPTVVSYALVFPAGMTALLTGSATALYALTAIAGSYGMLPGDENVLMARLLAVVGATFIAAHYRQGQIAFIAARWCVIAGAVSLTLWHAAAGRTQTNLAPLACLIAGNFVFHARYVMDLPVKSTLVELASALDLVLITLIILVMTPGIRTGIQNPFFVFYYPVILAFSLTFTRRRTLLYTSATSLIYAAVCYFVPPGIHSGADAETFAIRVVTLFATAGLGSYWARARSSTTSQLNRTKR